MPVPSASKAAILLALALSSGAGAVSPPPRFERVFATRAAPRWFHARVTYRGADGLHHLELWRDGEARLRRDTDARVTTVAQHRAGDPAYRLDMLDHARRIHSVVDRDSLYRIGRFTDWNDLAYGLKHPGGHYRLRVIPRAPVGIAPVSACDWYMLEATAGATRICWNRRFAYPLLIVDGADRLVWRVTALDTRPVPIARFRPRATDYVLNDAAADISGD